MQKQTVQQNIILSPRRRRTYAPFLWEMCFSGRPFLYGIQIFFRGFWVSSRGFGGGVLSSMPFVGKVAVAQAAAAAAEGTRALFPWCCSEGDRFSSTLLLLSRGWREVDVGPGCCCSRCSVPRSLCATTWRHVVFRSGVVTVVTTVLAQQP